MTNEPHGFMKHSTFLSITALACAALGVAFSYLLFGDADIYGARYQPIASRIVYFIGPLGWLLFSLLAAFLVNRFRGSSLGSVLAICFLSVLIVAGCILLFTPYYYPPFRASPEIAATCQAIRRM
jgi:hypothetical protein